LATDLPADRDLLAEGAWNDLYAWALLSGGWKLVRGGGEEDKGTSLLYDLGSDPGEIDDRAAREPALRERLERQLSLRLQEAEELRAGLIGGPLDEETAERVRSLGVSGE
jgi:hypothetical protein